MHVVSLRRYVNTADANMVLANSGSGWAVTDGQGGTPFTFGPANIACPE